MTTVRALIFDFDGLILDTEGPDYHAWREAFAAHGCTLPLAAWAAAIGTSGAFDPYAELEAQIGATVDRESLRLRVRARRTALLAAEAILPGVASYLVAARARGLAVGLASNSSRVWVAAHLERLGIARYFDCLSCSDDVGRHKPDPAVYQAALASLTVPPCAAIALEDSANGVRAAKQAGLFCVAVPNPLTAGLALDEADFRLRSLADLPLAQLLRLAEQRRQTV